MERLWKIPKTLVARTENAYALVGKGEDFAGACHEWAGPAQEVFACFDRLRTEVPGLKILTPGYVEDPDELSVIRKLESTGFDNRLEYLGLFKSTGTRYVIEDLKPESLKLPFFIWGLDSI
jgi:hypothetical protein